MIRPYPGAWRQQILTAILLVVIVAILTFAPGCVRRGTVCLEASHGRVEPNWTRQDNVGVSVCAEVAPPDE